MQVKKYTKKNNYYVISFENGKSLKTYEPVISKYQLLDNGEIADNLYEQLESDSIEEGLYQKSLKYLSVRLRSVYEMQTYLAKNTTDEKMINIVTERLLKNHELDDEVFTKAFVNDKIKLTSMGDYKIKIELQKLGVDDEIINRYVSQIDISIIKDKIEQLTVKYLKSSKIKDRQILKNKVYHNLMNQGFYHDQIMEILNKHFV